MAKYNKLLLLLVCLIILLGVYFRITFLTTDSYSGDHNTHIRAVTELLRGINPYEWTVESYANLENDPGNKGYAYLPAIMYSNAVIFLIHLYLKFSLNIDTSLPILMHLPGLIAQLFIGAFFIKELKYKILFQNKK